MRQPTPLDLATATLLLVDHGLVGGTVAEALPWPHTEAPEQLLEVAHALLGVAHAAPLLSACAAETVARFVDDVELDLAEYVQTGDAETLHWALEGARIALRLCHRGGALH